LNENGRKKLTWVTISLLLLFFCLPLFMFGASYLNMWIMSKGGDLYSFYYPYLQMASIYFAAALVAVGAMLYRLRCNFPGLLIVPVVLCLCGAIFFPNLQPHGINDSNYMTTVTFDCDEWAGAHHRYPANDLEMQEALRSTTRKDDVLRNGGLRWPEESQYRYQGQVLPYQVVVENQKKGPHVTNVHGRPGVVYYAVSPDFKEYWLTMSVLSSSTPGFANLLTENGQPYVMHRRLQDGWSRTEQ